MVDLAGHYDSGAEPQADFGPIPAGEYAAEIIESSVENVSKDESKGRCLVLVWKVINGEYAGRQVWHRLNLWFAGSEKTPGKVVQIANAEFASIREATGVKMPNDSAELHGKPCTIRVALTQDQGYAPKNEVKHVKATGAHQPFQQRQGGPPASSRGPAPSRDSGSSAGSAPWRKAG